jgi:hypothetical protein
LSLKATLLTDRVAPLATNSAPPRPAPPPPPPFAPPAPPPAAVFWIVRSAIATVP